MIPSLAKLSEYSDSQIEKIFIKYQNEAKKNPSEKLKKILVQINNERKKRLKKSSQTAAESSSNLSQLVSQAAKSNKSRREKARKKDSKISQKLRKTSAPMISTTKANIMLASALVFGFSGIVIIADHMWFSWINFLPYKLTIGIILIVPACICAKIASYLSDDSR